MKKKAFITGITGQDGSYLAELLLSKNYEVHGLIMKGDPGFHIKHLTGQITLHVFDLLDYKSWLEIFKKLKLDELYLLAAQSHVGKSFGSEIQTMDINIQPLYYIYYALLNSISSTRVFFACSSEIFSKVPGAVYREDSPLFPQNPYGISKAMGLQLSRFFRQAYSLNVNCGILFNHESPRRGRDFVTQKVCQSLKEIRAGRLEVLELGNLDAERDWGYAPDYVQAMWLMLQTKESDDFIIASGKLHSLREWVEIAAQQAGYKLEWKGKELNEVGIDTVSGKILIKINPEFYRKGPDVGIRGDITKITKKLKWENKMSMQNIITEMMRD